MLSYKIGDLLKAKEDGVQYIVHQVNCQGKMGSGIARQIKDKYPIVYEEFIRNYKYNDKPQLGQIDPIKVEDDFYVINLYGQECYGYDGRRYTSYIAFIEALNRIKSILSPETKIAFPYNIGCGLGGADWNIIKTIIDEILGDYFNVYIYKLEE